MTEESKNRVRVRDICWAGVLDYWRSRKAWFSFAWAALCPPKSAIPNLQNYKILPGCTRPEIRYAQPTLLL